MFFNYTFDAVSAAQIVNQLFPNLWIFIAHVLATISLLIILSRLVYRPFKKMMHERRKKIKSILIEANKKESLADKKLNENNKILQNTKNNINGMLKKAHEEIAIDKNKILDDANYRATEIINDAKQSIISDNEKNKEKIKETIGKTAIDIASKIIEKNIQQKDHKKIINNFIDNIDLSDDYENE